MAQPNFSQTSRKIAIMNNKPDGNNFIKPELIKAEKTKSNSHRNSNFQSTIFHQGSSKDMDRKYLIPKVNNIPSTSTTDSYSDEKNIKNVVRWLETLPSNQDWCKIEDYSPDRQGDFGKGKSQTKNTTNLNSPQPSTSFQKNPSESNSSENQSSLAKEATFKKSPGKVTFETDHRRENNSRYSKLSMEQKNRSKNNCDRLGKMKHISLASTLRADNRRSVLGYRNREENTQNSRRYSYNLRNLESRKIGVVDPREKITRTRRNCALRSQEQRGRAREVSSTRNQNQNDLNQPENLNPRKLKSPFTKQARSNTPSLLSDLPRLSSFNLTELKEMEENDKASEKLIPHDGKIITRSKLENNKKLLNSVKEIINNMDTDQDSNLKSIRKNHKTGNEKIDHDTLLPISQKSSEELKKLPKLNYPVKSKPTFINSQLEEKLNSEMEVTLNRYKRSYRNRENIWSNKKESCDQVEEPPQKKKKIHFKI